MAEKKAKSAEIELFRKSCAMTAEYICKYRENMTKFLVYPDVQPGFLRPLLPNMPPQAGEPFEKLLHDYHTKILPGTMHWTHPDMYAYFPVGSHFANLLGDMLSIGCGGINYSWASQPACAELENIAIDWLARAFGLPPAFMFEESKGKGGGVILSSASDSIFSAIVAARRWSLKKIGCYQQNGDLTNHPGIGLQKLVCYTSCETHSSTEKGANLALVDIRILTPNKQFKITGEILEEAIKSDIADGRVPFLFIGSIGSTGGVCFDDMQSCGAVAKKYDMWVHVDAAYAGNAFVLPEMQHLKYGFEYADTIECNPLKMMDAALELSVLWVRDLATYKETFIVDGSRASAQTESESTIYRVDFQDYGISICRRMRALKLWFLFRQLGLEGIRKIARSKIRLSKHFEKLVRQDNRFEVNNIVELGVVCFRQLENTATHEANRTQSRKSGCVSYLDQQNMNLLHRCNKSRKIHLVPTTLVGTYVLRISVNYVFATETDIERAWQVIQELYVTQLDKDFEMAFGSCGSTQRSINLPLLSMIKLVPEDRMKKTKKVPGSFGPFVVTISPDTTF